MQRLQRASCLPRVLVEIFIISSEFLVDARA